MVLYGPDIEVAKNHSYLCMIDDVPDTYLNACPVLMACYPNPASNSTGPGKTFIHNFLDTLVSPHTYIHT